MEEKQRTYEIRTGCDRGLCRAAVGRQDRQLNTYDWLADVPGNAETTDLVEVQFKHTRKGYYHNVKRSLPRTLPVSSTKLTFWLSATWLT